MAASCTDEGTAVVVQNGAVYACGCAPYGQLGLDSLEYHRLPEHVSNLELVMCSSIWSLCIES